ncbi:MAG: hypothetical protein Q9222_006414 [Ikaeria aurantiellina]
MPDQASWIINPQSDSPLFTILPPELRNHIFQLALTAYEDPTRRYKQSACYFRPGYTCAHKIDTALLATCRLIYSETATIPASINEHVSWYYRPPPDISKNEIPLGTSPASLIRRRNLRTIHLFAQQYWLEGANGGFAGFTGLWNFAQPTRLLITIRHTDWWWWEVEAPLALDPKQEGRPSSEKHSRALGPFEPESWGSEFRKIEGLERFELELETVESKRHELDAIVDRAKGWKFFLGDGHVLLLNRSKTRRAGWVGESLNAHSRDWIAGEMLEEEEEDDEEEQSATNTEQAVMTDSPDETLAAGSSATPEEESHVLAHVTIPTDDDTTIPYFGVENGTPACIPQAQDDSPQKAPSTAKERLKAAGVVFDEAASVQGLPEERTWTYYIVKLTWEAHQQVPMLMMSVCITFAPTFYTAAIYITLAKIVRYLGPEYARFRPSLYYWIFIPADIFSLVLQAVGGALSSTSEGGSDAAVDVSITGLAFQVFVICVFIALAIDYAWRYRKGQRVIPRTIPLSKKFKRFVLFLSISILFILIRCIYRIDELSDGYDGPLIHNEGLFIALEGV